MTLASSSLVRAFALLLLTACGATDPSVRSAPAGPNGAGDAGANGTNPGIFAPPAAGQTVDLQACGADNPAALSQAQVQLLSAGGEPGTMRFVYPYDGTVFPSGLAAPALMWEGEAEAEAVYVHLHSSTFRYQGCLKPDAAGRVLLPEPVWSAAASQTTGKLDPFQVELTVLRSGKASGPIRQRLIIAPGSLKGSVFYNSYSSGIARAGGATGGAVLRIPPGGQAELFVGQRGCAGCHGASADGKRLVTNEGVYALTPGIANNPPRLRAASTEFVGLTPDGALYAYQGKLVQTDTGAILSSALPSSASQVSFASDGRWATFIDGPVTPATGGIPVTIPGLNIPGLGGIPGLPTSPGSTAVDQGKLAIMRFDSATRSLSDYRLFKNVSSGAQWPGLVPDARAVVYTETSSNDLMLLDVASGTSTLLARAMGFATPADAQANKSYLPYASAGEARQAFFPTVAPVAVGGYFWVFFDSARRYGNFDTHKIESGLSAPAGINLSQVLPISFGGLSGVLPPSKQLWVSAIEISADGSYTHDASAPAFYLPGQEMGANNHRAFSALDPCLADGNSCQSGTACCSGFCGEGKCVAPPDRCAQTEEVCKTPSDCCNAQDQCIGGYCSVVVVL